jgi:hypothetical protein
MPRSIKQTIARIDGLQAAVQGRLWRAATDLPSEAATLRKLAGEIGNDFERLRMELRRGGELAVVLRRFGQVWGLGSEIAFAVLPSNASASPTACDRTLTPPVDSRASQGLGGILRLLTHALTCSYTCGCSGSLSHEWSVERWPQRRNVIEPPSANGR